MTKNATLNIRTTPAEIALWKRAAAGKKLAPWVRAALNQAAADELRAAAVIVGLPRAGESAITVHSDGTITFEVSRAGGALNDVEAT